MTYTLIICEKPTAAKAVAEALADSKPKKQGEKAAWYEFTKDGQDFVVVSAVGHLFTLKQTDKGWYYPVFNVDWVPSFKANKFAKFTEEYYHNIENLAKDAKDIVIATDYDDGGPNSIATINPHPCIPLVTGNHGRNVFVALVTRGAPTYAAGSLVVSFNAIQGGA